MQQMQSVFNLSMEQVQSHEDYPKYARSNTKPVIRARNIIDQGHISDVPCSTCVELDQDCYRWEGTFSKCAYCTSKDKKRELCHLPGQEASAPPERRKRRKITGNAFAPNGDAVSMADTMMSGTFVSAMTPTVSGAPMSVTRHVRGDAPSPEPTSAMTGMNGTRVAPPAASEAALQQATLERVTMLENQVAIMEDKIQELSDRLNEQSSCASNSSTPRRQAAAGASPTTSNITFEDLQVQHLSDAKPPAVNVAIPVYLATREWVEGPKTPEHVSKGAIQECELPDASPMQTAGRESVEKPKTPSTIKHTIEHAEGFGPVNCSCSSLCSMELDAVVPMEAEAVLPREADAGAEGNAFSLHGIASRGSLF